MDTDVVQTLRDCHALVDFRHKRAKDAEREQELIDKLRGHLTDALADITQAMRYPRTSQGKVGAAIGCLLKAREAAQELDPKEAA